ncbi:hypothetical protein V1527DRAFT_522571 [Lipomyces starkeyi]
MQCCSQCRSLKTSRTKYLLCQKRQAASAQGTYLELLLKKGYYYRMVMLHGSSIVKHEVVVDENETIWMLVMDDVSVAGGAYPAQAILFAKVIHIVSHPQSMYSALRHDANYFSLVFFMLTIKGCMFRLRKVMFRRYTRMDNVYFDVKYHYPESLSSILSSHPEDLKGFSGVTMATIIQVLTNVGAVLSLCVAWKLALVTLSTLPLLLPTADMQNRLLSKLEDCLQDVHRDATIYAAEKVDAPVKDTASLTPDRSV